MLNNRTLSIVEILARRVIWRHRALRWRNRGSTVTVAARDRIVPSSQTLRRCPATDGLSGRGYPAAQADRKLPHSSRAVQKPRRSARRRRRAAAIKSPDQTKLLDLGFRRPTASMVRGPSGGSGGAACCPARSLGDETLSRSTNEFPPSRASSKRRRPCQHAIAGDKVAGYQNKCRGWRTKPRHDVQRMITTASRRHREPDQTAGRGRSYRRSWCSPA